MIPSRVYEPQQGDIIYHYCGASAFLDICLSKKMRFSDLFSMNDFMEMHWGYSMWEKAAGQLLSEIGKDFLDQIDEVIHFSGYHGLLVASCFSLEGDVLSQWRAYADDGEGYAIGFSADDLLKLSVRALRVLYDHDQQLHELRSAIRAIHEAEKSESKKFGPDFVTYTGVLGYDLAAFKNPAFAEEKEVRLVHILAFQESSKFLRLTDEGGMAFGKKAKGAPVLFRMRKSTPVPYIDLDFTNKGKINPIQEVVIGPKNRSLSSGVTIFLETTGLPSVKVRRSKASYQ